MSWLRFGAIASLVLAAGSNLAGRTLTEKDAEQLVRNTPAALAVRQHGGCPATEYSSMGPSLALVQLRNASLRSGSGMIGNYVVDLQSGRVWSDIDRKNEVNSAQVAPEKSARIPTDLISAVRYDLGVFDPEESCLHEQHLRFQQAVSTSSITLNPAIHSAVVVRGLGPCFAGAHDGPFLIYARLGHSWRKIFDATGAHLERLNSTAKGWNDLALWFNRSGSQGVRHIYRFNGMEYVQARCDVADYNDPITHKPTRKPTFRPCQGELLKP